MFISHLCVMVQVCVCAAGSVAAARQVCSWTSCCDSNSKRSADKEKLPDRAADILREMSENRELVKGIEDKRDEMRMSDQL